MPWRRKWQPTPVFLPGKSQGQRGLVGYSPWGHKESDMTKQLTFSLSRGERLGFNNFGFRDNYISSYLFSFWWCRGAAINIPSKVKWSCSVVSEGEKWGIRYSNAALQVWMEGSEELGIRVAGLRIGHHSKENSGYLRRVTHEGDRMVIDLWESKSLKSCGE